MAGQPSLESPEMELRMMRHSYFVILARLLHAARTGRTDTIDHHSLWARIRGENVGNKKKQDFILSQHYRSVPISSTPSSLPTKTVIIHYDINHDRMDKASETEDRRSCQPAVGATVFVRCPTRKREVTAETPATWRA